MFTCLVLVVIFMVVAAVVALLTGILAILPFVGVIICLPVLDYFVFKMIFKRKKGAKKKGR